ncbi:MAG: hypothetical protein QNJ41_22950 [Xenococcaceae cyanobacterium MO_188.B32]|nr:hypothetical protein [Xenococcaceae cyanobacterium MO_188.B32]
MNIKLIVFSGFVTASLGIVLGLATAEMSRGELKPIQLTNSQLTQNSPYKHYGLIGATIGFIVGMSQECVRELKYIKEQERQDFYQNNYN